MTFAHNFASVSVALDADTIVQTDNTVDGFQSKTSIAQGYTS